jgi:hypothetical protein
MYRYDDIVPTMIFPPFFWGPPIRHLSTKETQKVSSRQAIRGHPLMAPSQRCLGCRYIGLYSYCAKKNMCFLNANIKYLGKKKQIRI